MDKQMWFKARNEIIWERNLVLCLQMAIADDLKFEKQLSELYKRAKRK